MCRKRLLSGGIGETRELSAYLISGPEFDSESPTRKQKRQPLNAIFAYFFLLYALNSNILRLRNNSEARLPTYRCP
jgi:hypothetical protein